ncbi:MAG: hypothetical protein ABSB11_01630 [Sedimentisphaerales bacterium]|jgi:hypothetical protein
MAIIKYCKFINSPITALFATFILTAIASSGKVSMNYSNFLLIIAGLIGFFGIYRSLYGILLKFTACLFLVIMLVTISWWIKPDKAVKPLTPENPIAKEAEVAKQIHNIDTKQAIRTFFESVDPVILQKIDVGQKKLLVYFSIPQQVKLEDLPNLPNYGNYLSFEPNYDYNDTNFVNDKNKFGWKYGFQPQYDLCPKDALKK